jgi:hypothetical protein
MTVDSDRIIRFLGECKDIEFINSEEGILCKKMKNPTSPGSVKKSFYLTGDAKQFYKDFSCFDIDPGELKETMQEVVEHANKNVREEVMVDVAELKRDYGIDFSELGDMEKIFVRHMIGKLTKEHVLTVNGDESVTLADGTTFNLRTNILTQVVPANRKRPPKAHRLDSSCVEHEYSIQIAEMAKKVYGVVSKSLEYTPIIAEEKSAFDRCLDLVNIWRDSKNPAVGASSIEVDALVMNQWIYNLKRKCRSLDVSSAVCPILFSRKQEVGKSYAIQCLTGAIGVPQLVGDAKLSSFSDDRSHLSDFCKLVMCLEELASGQKKTEMAAIKKVITQTKATVRPLYDRTTREIRVMTSYIGTSNIDATQIFYDPTGMRRFHQIYFPENLDDRDEKCKQMREFDYLSLYKSVDEFAEQPYDTHKEIYVDFLAYNNTTKKKDVIGIFLSLVGLNTEHISEFYSHSKEWKDWDKERRKKEMYHCTPNKLHKELSKWATETKAFFNHDLDTFVKILREEYKLKINVILQGKRRGEGVVVFPRMNSRGEASKNAIIEWKALLYEDVSDNELIDGDIVDNELPDTAMETEASEDACVEIGL